MYKVADANHRFYVDKRFKIISLYYPSATLVLTALYSIARVAAQIWYMQTLLSIVGLGLTLFLYELESRNWILSNICSDRCVSLGSLLEGKDNLHVILSGSYKAPLPAYSTTMDKLAKNHLTDNVQRFANYCTKQMVADDRLKLYISLFKDAVRERNLLFRFVKFWTQLEAMALQYAKGKPKKEKVRALFEHFQISTGEKTYDGHDYLDIAYKVRNNVAHEGKAVGQHDPSWLTHALKESSQILNWLEHATAFVIRRYIVEKTARV